MVARFSPSCPLPPTWPGPSYPLLLTLPPLHFLQLPRAKQYLPFFQRSGKMLGVVEYVLSGHRLKVSVGVFLLRHCLLLGQQNNQCCEGSRTVWQKRMNEHWRSARLAVYPRGAARALKQVLPPSSAAT